MKETTIGIIGCIILACVIGAGILIRNIAGGTSSDATWNAYPDWDAICDYLLIHLFTKIVILD